MLKTMRKAFISVPWVHARGKLPSGCIRKTVVWLRVTRSDDLGKAVHLVLPALGWICTYFIKDVLLYKG